MDPDALVEALRGTMDPSLREAAEKQLGEVKVELSGELWWRLWRGSGLGRWQHQDGAIAHIGRSFRCDEIRFSARYYLRPFNVPLLIGIYQWRTSVMSSFNFSLTSVTFSPMTLLSQFKIMFMLASRWTSCRANANQVNTSYCGMSAA